MDNTQMVALRGSDTVTEHRPATDADSVRTPRQAENTPVAPGQRGARPPRPRRLAWIYRARSAPLQHSAASVAAEHYLLLGPNGSLIWTHANADAGPGSR